MKLLYNKRPTTITIVYPLSNVNHVYTYLHSDYLKEVISRVMVKTIDDDELLLSRKRETIRESEIQPIESYKPIRIGKTLPDITKIDIPTHKLPRIETDLYLKRSESTLFKDLTTNQQFDIIKLITKNHYA